MGCEKEPKPQNSNLLIPIVEQFDAALNIYSLKVVIATKRADRLSLEVSDAFGNVGMASAINLNPDKDVLEFDFDLKAEKLLEGRISLGLELANDEGTTRSTKLMEFLPFRESTFGLVIESNQGEISMVSLDSAGVQHSNDLTYTADRGILYVGSGYNPWLLFQNEGQWSKKRLFDTVSEPVFTSIPTMGNAIAALETIDEVIVPFTSGDYVVLPRNLSNYSLISSSFQGELTDFFRHKSYWVLLYSVNNNTYFEIRNAQSNQVVRPLEQYNYEQVFSNGNQLIFVESSEGGFYNYRAYDVDRQSFNVVGNTSVFTTQASVAHSDALAFVGEARGETGIFTIRSQVLEPQLEVAFSLSDYSFYTHKSLFASSVLVYSGFNGYRLYATRSSDYPVPLNLVLSADDLVNVKSMYLVPN